MITVKSQLTATCKLIAACAALSLSPAALASSTWDLTSSGGCSRSGGANLGNSWSCTTAGGPTATVTAWAGDTSANFSGAEVAQFGGSGFGVRNTTSSGNDYSDPQHSMDNSGKTDLLFFDFGNTQVSLDFVKFGWYTNDSDFSLLAYTGPGSPGAMGNYDTQGTDGITAAGTGWTLVNHFSNVGTSSTAVTPTGLNADGTVKAGDTYSSWWIISAYDSNYGASSFTSTLNDYLKLQYITGQVKPPSSSTGVPEPGSLALIGAAFIGLVATRRAKRTSV